MTEASPLHVDGAELARRRVALQALIDRDAEIGAAAQQRVAHIYGPQSAASLGSYDFSDSNLKSDQVSRRSDWVHEGRLRPVRFIYRHVPKPIRYAIKKLFA